jgi:tryptophan synthase alpha chain
MSNHRSVPPSDKSRDITSVTAGPLLMTPEPPPFRLPSLTCYFPLGDPRVPVEMVDVYADQGVDVLEIGLASPDPYLDGPDVRGSMARAISRWAGPDRARADLDRLLDRLARRGAAPATLLMSYADADHPGIDDPAFWAGLDSLLVVAPEAAWLRHRIEACARAAGLHPSVFLSLPVSPAGLEAARAARFYVMLQAVAGVTGPRDGVDPGNAARIADLRRAGVSLPILPGFGISTGAQAAALRAMGADGVVVGSSVLRMAIAGAAPLAALLQDLRRCLDG